MFKRKTSSEDAQVDFIFGNKVGGNVAQTLINNGMDINSLRTNSTLLYDEWKQFDEAVIQEALLRLSGVQDLMSRNLVYRFPNGLGKTVLANQNADEGEDADVSMDAVTKGKRERPNYEIEYLPLPIIHKDFSISIRDLEASRNGSQPIDTTLATRATRKVSEKIESFLFQGSGSYTFGGGTIYGYVDAPNRNTVSLTTPWDSSGATGLSIFNDVIAMKQAAIADRHYGPYVLYIPTAYETVMDTDYVTTMGNTKTIRTRLMEIEGISGIKISDYLASDNVILVQMSADVVRMVEGLPLRTVQWDSEGGMMINFKVMSILVPQIRNTQALRSGIVHLS